MLVLLFFAFISGLVTIFAPCIWPLLPIILSSSINGGKAKSLGITLGIMASFSIFILSISYLVSLFGLDPNIIRLFAVIVLVIMGLSMIVPAFSRILEGMLSRFSGRFGQSQTRSGFGGGFLTGCSLGIVWTPCTGPILATIATLAATTNVSLGIIFVTIVYVIGLGIPLFFFSYGGGKLIAKTRFVSGLTGRIQQIFGVVILLTALAIYTNYDKVLQVKLLDSFPSYTKFLIGLETNPAVKEQLDILKGNKEKKTDEMIGKPFSMPDSSRLPNLGKAPEFAGINKWLNSQPLTLQSLRGKVVLVDFWTYTCINCIRTLPFVTGWYEKYKGKGFVVVGVHTPEFEFEKKTENVEQAIKQYNIHYPVAQDNDYATWTAYQNQYWPAKYLIDAKGVIRWIHFGEGEYEKGELAIQELLKEAGNLVLDGTIKALDQTPKAKFSPETYLGSSRMQYLYPNRSVSNGNQTFSLSKNIPSNSFSFGGEWMVDDEYSKTGKNAVLEYNFFASKVFLVMKPTSLGAGEVKVYLDGKLIDNLNSGIDVENGIVTVDKDRLYNLVELKNAESHLLRLEFSEGIEIFAFTFG